MREQKPLRIENRFILSKRFYDVVADNIDTIGDVATTSFFDMVQQLEGTVFNLQDWIDCPFDASLKLSFSNLTKRDMDYIRKNSPLPEIWGDAITMSANTTFQNPDTIFKYLKNGKFEVSEIVAYRTCSNFVEIFSRRLFVLLSIYLPGSSSCFFSYDKKNKVSK